MAEISKKKVIKKAKKVIYKINKKESLYTGISLYLNDDVEKHSSHTLELIISPTGNCQFGSIIDFQYFIGIKCDNLDELLKQIVLAIDKPMFLIDIREEILKPTLKLITECGFDIKFQNKYESTNYSIMNIIMVDASNYFDEYHDL